MLVTRHAVLRVDGMTKLAYVALDSMSFSADNVDCLQLLRHPVLDTVVLWKAKDEGLSIELLGDVGKCDAALAHHIVNQAAAAGAYPDSTAFWSPVNHDKYTAEQLLEGATCLESSGFLMLGDGKCIPTNSFQLTAVGLSRLQASVVLTLDSRPLVAPAGAWSPEWSCYQCLRRLQSLGWECALIRVSSTVLPELSCLSLCDMFYRRASRL